MDIFGVLNAACVFGCNKGVQLSKHGPIDGTTWFREVIRTCNELRCSRTNVLDILGLSVGYGIRETAIKEAAEEASIPESLAEKIVSAGCVSFFFESERGLFPNTGVAHNDFVSETHFIMSILISEYVYDLELPLDFMPTNADGEVSFSLQLHKCSRSIKNIL